MTTSKHCIIGKLDMYSMNVGSHRVKQMLQEYYIPPTLSATNHTQVTNKLQILANK